jgi:hypothetical protein
LRGWGVTLVDVDPILLIKSIEIATDWNLDDWKQRGKASRSLLKNEYS